MNSRVFNFVGKLESRGHHWFDFFSVFNLEQKRKINYMISPWNELDMMKSQSRIYYLFYIYYDTRFIHIWTSMNIFRLSSHFSTFFSRVDGKHSIHLIMTTAASHRNKNHIERSQSFYGFFISFFVFFSFLNCFSLTMWKYLKIWNDIVWRQSIKSKFNIIIFFLSDMRVILPLNKFPKLKFYFIFAIWFFFFAHSFAFHIVHFLQLFVSEIRSAEMGKSSGFMRLGNFIAAIAIKR